MSNKQVMDKLEAYFLEQDPAFVAKVCASHMIDLNRWYHFGNLSPNERSSLIDRTYIHIEELKKFLKEDKHKKMKLTISNSKQDNICH